MKIAFFDIDGTLVSFSTHSVPKSTLTALHKLHENNVEIVIVTGRGATPIPEIADIPFSSIIGLNGSERYINGTTVVTHSIPSELYMKALDLGDKYDFAIAAKTKDGYAVDKVTPRVEAMAKLIESALPPVQNLREITEPVGQLCFFTDPDTEQIVMQSLPGLSASRWCDIFADINVAGVDKGTAVREYVALRDVELKDTIAFGDGGNDIPMLQAAGIGVAMGNSSDAVKAEADYIADNIDCDGIAKALRHFRLI